MERDRILAWLADQVPPARLRHILGVEQLAQDLAAHYQLNVIQAQKAGLMHDLAKYFSPSRLLAIAQQAGIEIDDICHTTPHLLHAEVSAIIARDEFGETDPEVLNAIRHHTLGQPDMSPLSCILFIADALEPNRGNSEELVKLRHTMKEDLYGTVWKTSDYGLQYLLNKRCIIHPRTILTRNWAMQQSLKSHRVQQKDSH
ncbi:bis(5'-nucleosyl)-tetraphosphatase (symmetrical) YqeK [Spirulina subsalsa FACHB-351]|uniref:bis(5'-nucleosyl)-tetraphosphatase (symmetrical) n=1 Tax=Spirulina subsalsa FACHB-351 TaxID=234711 RepID=A0ABT3L255_9CYAN|nr:bis(5'-nucleosyl)-tetraphosphatase (symmetrical) YqeK [Spirulina subsalsa]MCW6035587.1 bis(5'-nucleosyl)-tetraphosphatase (symmetrical) YqeK [Spirulina subsalsa FACHB-351]